MFVTSAGVLVLEILAGRLLAPYVGVTLETYTGIIGTVLAGIALGNWLGGRLADTRDPRTLLGPTIAIGGMLALACLPVVRTFGPALAGRAPVAIVALPLAMALAIASGTTPEKGLYTAIVAGILISVLGGSRVQIGGPTGAFVVVISGIVATYGLDGLFMCTLMAGAMLVLLGITGLGTAVKYIPRPVVIGFTTASRS